MSTAFELTDQAIKDALFVFALESEAGNAFAHCDHLFTGIGKINAAYMLGKRIMEQRPSLIINLGSAGSSHFKKGDVVCCRHFVQRDMDVRGLGFALYETPLSGIAPLLEYGVSFGSLPEATCGTGDNFEMSHTATAYNIVDMEAYALALVAMKENIPFLCLKYISDGADDSAADDWTVMVHLAAEKFRQLLIP